MGWGIRSSVGMLAVPFRPLHKRINLLSLLLFLRDSGCFQYSSHTPSFGAGGQVDTFILDFEKAFDTPLNELLKCKLHGYGISGKTLGWIDSFLCNRQQRVVVNRAKTQWAPVLSGVPQGTVFSPLLFSLYINDIMVGIESEIRLFADDCVCCR